MSFRINRTEEYHRSGLETLGWELTVCNALERANTPCRRLLAPSDTFGNLLFEYLRSLLPVNVEIGSVLEVGGGYGYLMRDFLNRIPSLRATMLDLSPFLLSRQRETLSGRDVHYICLDFFETDAEFFQAFDLVLLNEVVGDFPTACDVTMGSVERVVQPTDDNPFELIERYRLDVPVDRPFHLNIGALRAVEILCRAGVPAIYLSEHSCEAKGLTGKVEGTGFPERIRLYGHDEYTIRFSHLERIAEQCGYRGHRGPYADFLQVEFDERLRYILSSSSTEDEHEILRHFVFDLFKYEYLILTKSGIEL